MTIGLRSTAEGAHDQFGADEVIDLDKAVRDPAYPANVDPAYLANGTPNDAYYQRIAQTFTGAVVNGEITL